MLNNVFDNLNLCIKSVTSNFFEDTKSKNLDEVEDKMWYSIAEKLWCENC